MLRKSVRYLLSIAGALEDWLKRRLDSSLARSLSGSDSLSFSQDYVSGFQADWTRHLAPYAGEADIALLEIGCFEGRATLWFLQNILTHPTARITCVDSFTRRGGEPRFDHNIALSGYASKTTKIKGRSEDVVPGFAKDSFDAVYIDGSHRAVDVLMDAVAAWRILKPGGTLIFDDYGWGTECPRSERPGPAIDLFIDTIGAQAEVLQQGYQVILRKVSRPGGR